MDKLASRKFMLAVLAQGSGTVALFTGDMEGAVYVALTTVVLGAYGIANVMEKRNGK
jgi:hypothetical protein